MSPLIQGLNYRSACDQTKWPKKNMQLLSSAVVITVVQNRQQKCLIIVKLTSNITNDV